MKNDIRFREQRKRRDDQTHPEGFHHHAHEHQPQQHKGLAALGRGKDREKLMGGGRQEEEKAELSSVELSRDESRGRGEEFQPPAFRF